jgi:hypothetical protein
VPICISRDCGEDAPKQLGADAHSSRIQGAIDAKASQLLVELRRVQVAKAPAIAREHGAAAILQTLLPGRHSNPFIGERHG